MSASYEECKSDLSSSLVIESVILSLTLYPLLLPDKDRESLMYKSHCEKILASHTYTLVSLYAYTLTLCTYY